jgi:hypothetical protein
MGSLSKLTFCGNGGTSCYPEGDAVTIDTTMTEADFSGKKLGTAGAQILAAFMSTELFEAKGSLSSITFGDRSSNYIKKTMVSGSSFTTGSEVEYAGSKYKIVQEVDSDGELKVEPRVVFSATLNTDMTEANLEGLGLGSSGAIIVSAFIPKW